MRRHLRLVVVLSVLALLCVAVPSVATAQEREGFWFGIGAGVGLAEIRCDDCDTGRENGGVGNIRLGWTLNEHLLLGGEVNAWAKTFALEEDLTATAKLYNVSATLTYYPKVTSGFFVKGGAGVSGASMDFDLARTNVTVEVGTGPGLFAGAGYDLRVGRRISVTPAVNVWHGQLGDVTLSGAPLLNNWKHNVVDFTLGITFH